MNVFPALPDWLPWWVPTIILILALLWVLAFLLVPFSVIGLKARLDGLEARLDEIQAEIRTLTLRLQDRVQPVEFDELYSPPPTPEPVRRGTLFSRPPIPPAAHQLDSDESEFPPPGTHGRARRTDPPRGAARSDRVEPKLERPR